MSGNLDEVPKLPRGRGLKFSKPELFRIALTIITLLGVIVMAKPCANAVSGFVAGFEGSASTSMPKPGTVDQPMPGPHYEEIRPGMTDDEIKAVIERSRARANAASGGATPAPSAGSATTP